MTHKLPNQVCRLINRLNGENTVFIVHVDKNNWDESFSKCLSEFNNVFFVTPTPCFWGDISLVKATLNSIKLLLEKEILFDYAILLSGQDYPLKNNKVIKDFFYYSDGNLYMEIFNEKDYTKAWQSLVFNFRLKNYFVLHNGSWYCLDDTKTISIKCEDKWDPIVDCKIPFDIADYVFPRKIPSENIDLWGGSQWWALTYDAVKYIYEFVAKNEEYLRFHEYTFIPDEIFFQTILMNHKKFRNRVINHKLRFIDWSRDIKPMIFDDSYTREFESSIIKNPNYLFARKFDLPQSYNILNAIDYIL